MDTKRTSIGGGPGIDVIILAGGHNSRMGGRDKAQLERDGLRFIDCIVAELRSHYEVSEIVVVTPREFTLPEGVVRTCEDPAFGGPVAGIAAGAAALRNTPGTRVLILAVDAPDAARLLPALSAALADSDVAVVRSTAGFLEPLCALWNKDSLLKALNTLPNTRDIAAKRLIAAAPQVVQVAGTGAEQDYDTPESLSRWRPEG
ncbi:molybdenum cofactor guanylyltransferase [Corynebacterium canis]|uniref:Molybdenum cofactor guanylyltransferase n=1 Tax=Corynebacterium canis TaxID=679663 RepID=A0A5C5US31_9CORY|nr:NTP transferase domain-containing protein [Corynebacterium canis]TWT28838.1 molybdenum cofactor guanylyltransferase [Corynebacterium canis]WJY74973.1 molybdopterin-guanine dinucleotide biosynthesis protein MobA [Corynebacterium canis]